MRRGNGDGSIFKLSGKRRRPYAVRITVGWSDDGKQKYKYIGYYANKTEAKKSTCRVYQRTGKDSDRTPDAPKRV